MMIQAVVAGRAVIMVLLDAKGSAARAADAGRMRKWLEALKPVGLPTGLPTSTLTTGAVGGGTGQAYSTGM
jgi:D-alanyl-D-alanine endopeptidase (penicillin-binding protein 7)